MANTDGTALFAERAKRQGLVASHYRQLADWTVSSIGLGTYLGDDDDATDLAYERAITTAIASGCNLIDSAIAYRNQRSERVVGRTLKRLREIGSLQGTEVVVSSKGGYLPGDSSFTGGDIRRYVEETFIKPGILTRQDVVGGSHCMTPLYLKTLIRMSLRNLELDSIDLYYLHNPETQLKTLNRGDFLNRTRAAFTALEEAGADGLIHYYGTATWSGYRVPVESEEALRLPELVNCAKEAAGGDNHRFRVIQVPFNLAMSEALDVMSQAADYGLAVVASTSLSQAQLAHDLPNPIRDLIGPDLSDAQRALQFARSAPGVTAALVGMTQETHVRENLSLGRIPPLDRARFTELLF